MLPDRGMLLDTVETQTLEEVVEVEEANAEQEIGQCLW